MCLLLGNVLQPIENAREIPCGAAGVDQDPGGRQEEELVVPEQENEKGSVQETSGAKGSGDNGATPTAIEGDWEMVGQSPKGSAAELSGTGRQLESLSVNGVSEKQPGPKLSKLHTVGADIICAFNYSTCCLHSRQELLRYFHYARKGLSGRGGVFAMDLYGGTSSECALRLKRRFGDFTVRRASQFGSSESGQCHSERQGEQFPIFWENRRSNACGDCARKSISFGGLIADECGRRCTIRSPFWSVASYIVHRTRLRSHVVAFA